MIQTGTKVGSETGCSGKRTQQELVWKEINRKDGQRREERTRI
jgi:hypothetical protein